MATSTTVETPTLIQAITHSRAFREAIAGGLGKCCIRGNEGQTVLSDAAVPPARNSIGVISCPSSRYCSADQIVIPKGLVEGPFAKPVSLGSDLPRFLPLENPLDRRTFAHEILEGRFPAIVVQTWALFQSRPTLELIRSRGLADAMNYDGKIILTSVMPDRYVVGNDVDWFVETVKQLNPYAAITWDVPTYVNHPKWSSLQWVLDGLDGARRMALALDLPLVGLVSGADLSQVRVSSTCLRMLGFKDQALACREYMMARQIGFLKSCVDIVKRAGASTMMLSCSSPDSFSEFPAADYFAGMRWFHRSRVGRGLYDKRAQSRRTAVQEKHDLAKENLVSMLKLQDIPGLSLEDVAGFG